MAYLRQSAKFLLREENFRKEEIRKKREVKMKKKIKDLGNRVKVTETILKYSKQALNEEFFSEPQRDLYKKSLMWLCHTAEECLFQLYDLTGNLTFLNRVDKLYGGLK